MKSIGIYWGILVVLSLIMTLEVSLSKGEGDPSSEDAAVEEDLKGPVDTLCYVCKARGRRWRLKKGNVLHNCLHVSTTENVSKVMCQHGCMAAYGTFKNYDVSIERWCVGGSQEEQQLVDVYAVFKTRRVVEKVEGSMYSCDKIYFDDGTEEKKNSSGVLSRAPLSYNYCWCRGNECNGRQINGLIGAKASGRIGGGGESGRLLMTFAIALIFGLLWIPGTLGQKKITCNFCTEKTHSDCFEGGGNINSQNCDPLVHETDSCIKMQTCVSGLPCEIYRGCTYKNIDKCLEIADVKVNNNECNKRKFKLNTPWGSSTYICVDSLKTYFEKRVWKGRLIKPESDFDDEDQLKATKADAAIVEIEYCHCNTKDCNGAVGLKGLGGGLVVLIGLLGFVMGTGGGRARTLMTWLLIVLTVLTMMVPCQGNNVTTIDFDCFKCSNSKTSCYYTYLEECPSIDITKKNTVKNVKYQDKTCKNDTIGTRLCKVLTTQHVLDGGPKETEKGCLDHKELQCFEETFQLTVTPGGCTEKSVGYEEYTKWLRCNVKSKVKITSNYNEGVVNIMEQMQDFYGDDEGENEFTVRFCTCNPDTSLGCNYNLS